MTTITLPRAVVEQALETIEGLTRDRLFTAEWAGKHGATITALRAALEQQAEPDAYGYASYLAVAIWEKYYKDTAPHWKPLDDLVGVMTQIDNMTSGLTRLAQQAEPLNLSDPAVQKRLATQWGYVPAAQAEPVEPVVQFDLNTMPGQADAHLRALLRYTENFYATAIEHGMRAGPTANAIAHVERAGKALHQIVHAQAKMLEPARPVEPVEPVEPVAWEGWWLHHGQHNYRAKPLSPERVKELMKLAFEVGREAAPPQRKPLTEEEIYHATGHCGVSKYTAINIARVIEEASWKKNHGQA